MSFAKTPERANATRSRPEQKRTYVRVVAETKTCGRCGLSKPVAEFAWRRRRKRQRDNMCRPCRSAYGREHYLANRRQYIEAEARRKRERAELRTRLLLAFFRDHPCMDCGETDPLVLEFDHLKDKKFNIGHQFASRSWEAILEEMDKCDVVCSNCHRRRTARRRGYLRALLAAEADAASTSE